MKHPWMKYQPTVNMLLPKAEGEELEHRCRILLMRDNAKHSIRNACDEALPILGIIQNLAILNAYRAEKEMVKPISDAISELYKTARRLNEVGK